MGLDRDSDAARTAVDLVIHLIDTAAGRDRAAYDWRLAATIRAWEDDPAVLAHVVDHLATVAAVCLGTLDDLIPGTRRNLLTPAAFHRGGTGSDRPPGRP